MRSRRTNIASQIDREPAGPVARFAVAGLLGVAAGLVAGRPRRAPRLNRLSYS